MQVDRVGRGAQHAHELVVDDLDHHLAGLDRLHDLLADGLGLHRLDEVLDHVERHVGFEQCAADLAHRLGDVALRQRTAPGELVENA